MKKSKVKTLSLSLLPSLSILSVSSFVFSCEVSDNNEKHNIDNNKNTNQQNLQTNSLSKQSGLDNKVNQSNDLESTNSDSKIEKQESPTDSIDNEKDSQNKEQKNQATTDTNELNVGQSDSVLNNPKIEKESKIKSENTSDSKSENHTGGKPTKTVDNSFYPTQPSHEFTESNLKEDEIKEKILSAKYLSSNYFSHPDYKIKDYKTVIRGDGKDPKKLELIDKSGNVVSDVKWFIRTQYPGENVYSSSDQTPEDVSINITNDGVVTGKKHQQEQRTYQVWAEWKGYLFKTYVQVLSDDEIRGVDEDAQSRAKVKEIVKGWDNLSDINKVLKAYDWIAENVEYKIRGDLISDQTAYSCLIEKSCVCAGYAKGFELFMNELNIPTKTIVGEVRREWHIWNLVEIEGKWYHIDVTWDANVEWQKNRKKVKRTTYTYFLVNDNDIKPGRRHTKPFLESMMGSKYRGYKLDNLIKSEEDIRRIVEMQVSEKYNSESKFVSFVTGNSFTDHDLVEKIIQEKTGQKFVKKHEGWRNINFKTLSYAFSIDNSKISEIKTIDLNAEKISNDKSDYIIKIYGDNLPDLSKENIWVKNAFIENVEKVGNDYLVYLSNFDNFGSCEVELSVYKIGYKFNIVKNNKLTFNVLRHEKPKAQFIGINSNSGILKNLDLDMEYRLGLDPWQDVKTTEIELNNIGTREISVRKKASKSMMASQIQKISASKPSYIDKEVKVNNNKIIGVDSNMQYRLVDTNNWIDINSIYLENLKPGTYELRTKPGVNLLASDIVRVQIH
ncbi:hypothetical protein LAD74_01245 [Mycoplasma sp. U97]|uniref:MAG6410 family transglutaminase-related lipoprotein n=1 Tax=Mycoplasma tauri TaxID=547987 RepID=UPI001CC03287|nr:transglutaminase domain-containing protein [Mycoplasma tauri]MBZ4212616.1 hypothetical protein [Mycoplasma tauri]